MLSEVDEIKNLRNKDVEKWFSTAEEIKQTLSAFHTHQYEVNSLQDTENTLLDLEVFAYFIDFTIVEMTG